MSEQLNRATILQKRLTLLNEYIKRESEANMGVTFAAFLRSKGITHLAFIKDLPPRFRAVPSRGLENIIDYATAMAGLLENQLELHADATYSIVGDDGEDEENFNCCGSADGSEASETLNCSSCENNCGGGDESFHNASALGTICLKPIAPIIGKKLAPGMWRSYENKKKKYAECLKKKAELKASGKNRLLHITNLSNPGLAGVRVSFLKVIAYNIFGLAQTFERMRKDPDQTHWKKLNAWWYNWGGSEKKLDSNISIGHNKKPIFRPKGWKPKAKISADGEVYHNSEAATIAYLTFATALIGSVAPIVNSFKKTKGEAPTNFNEDPGANEQIPDDSAGGADIGNEAGMPIPVKIGIGVGIAVVVGGLIWGISKAIK